MEFIKIVADKLKLKEIFAIVFIAAIVLTFIPQEMAQTMKIEDFRNTYQSYISICIIIAGAYYLFSITCWSINKIKKKIHSPEKIAIDYMKRYMTVDEMALLIEKYYDAKNNIFRSTATIELSDGRKAALESKFILYRASNISSFFTEFPYNLQPFALEFLNKNLLAGNIKIDSTQFSFILI